MDELADKEGEGEEAVLQPRLMLVLDPLGSGASQGCEIHSLIAKVRQE